MLSCAFPQICALHRRAVMPAVVLVLSRVFPGTAVAVEEFWIHLPELSLSRHRAIQSAIDNHVNGLLLEECIAAAHANTSSGP